MRVVKSVTVKVSENVARIYYFYILENSFEEKLLSGEKLLRI